jgi:hypothetical protein
VAAAAAAPVDRRPISFTDVEPQLLDRLGMNSTNSGVMFLIFIGRQIGCFAARQGVRVKDLAVTASAADSDG